MSIHTQQGFKVTQVKMFLIRQTSSVPWIHYVIDACYTSILKILCRTHCVNCSFADTELRMRLAGCCACSIVCGQAGVLKFSLEYCIYVSLFQWKLLKFLIRFSIVLLNIFFLWLQRICQIWSQSTTIFFKNLDLPSLIRFCMAN